MATARAALLPVAAHRVAKRFGGERALVDVSLELRSGALTVLLGPNGAGKSTLVGILSTLVRPSAGTVEYGDLGAAARGPAGEAIRARIGLVAHEPLLYGDLTAVENLRLFARLYDIGDAERGARLLERLGLARAAHRPVRTYSRGMLQRLALCRALLHRPELLLLDEPFTGLDAEGVDVLVETIAAERELGHALLLTTHDVTPLDGLCDHVAMLRRGRLVAEERGKFAAEELRALQRKAQSG